eukprot:2016093-Lingulodinium_polyedra.AAC.1
MREAPELRAFARHEVAEGAFAPKLRPVDELGGPVRGRGTEVVLQAGGRVRRIEVQMVPRGNLFDEL